MPDGWDSATGEMRVDTTTGSFRTGGHFCVENGDLFIFDLSGGLVGVYASGCWSSVSVMIDEEVSP